MNQRRLEKPKPEKSGPSPPSVQNGQCPRKERPSAGPAGADQTQAQLVALTRTVERLIEKVEGLEGAQAAPPIPKRGETSGHWLDRLLWGRLNGALGAVSSATAVLSLLLSISLALLKALPLPPGAFPGWRLSDIVRPLVPPATLIASVVILVLASRWLRQKALRLRFLTAVLACYGAATVVYMAWLSLGFLHYNTLPSGVLLALTWSGIAAILRRTLADVREMRALIRDQTDKQAGHETMAEAAGSGPGHERAAIEGAATE